LNGLAYKPFAAEVVQRLRLLYARQATDRIFAAFDVPSAALAEFTTRYPHGFCPYPEPADRACFWDRLLAEKTSLEDDSMPSAYLSEMDQGLYGGLLGGEVQFMAHPENGWISSMVAPLLADWSAFDRLHFDRAPPWFTRYLNQLETFASAAEGKFGVSHFILIDGLNFAFELVGATKTYMSLVDHPDMIRRTIEFAYQLNVEIHEAFFARTPQFHGGTFSNMVQWIPGRIVSESVDPFHMTSVAYFEQWGREPVERIFARFDGGVLHLHGNGRHLLEAVSTVRGLKAVFLGDDKGFPPAFEVLASLRARAGDLPLVVETRFDRFVDALRQGRLPGGVLYRVQSAPNVTTVNRLMEEVRAYRTG
jgi:hypothetical protein